MRILALNCGSSSIKSALIDTQSGARLLDVRILALGSPDAHLQIDGAEQKLSADIDLAAAVRRIVQEVVSRAAASGAIEAVVHRVVHGGPRFTQPTLIDESTLTALAALNSLAPLHNPPALAAIAEARSLLSDLPHVAVFDTAFHSTLPTRAREYALPRDLAQQMQIRRYGFHGTSHAHVMNAVADYLRQEPQQLRIVSCHLGNGASVAAIEYGRSVETSMGMTPLEGLVMGTRCGDIDPGILLLLQQSAGMDVKALDRLLNSESGLQGLTGTNEMQVIERRAAEGDEPCRLAITLYSHRVRKYIGAYAAVMGGVDVIAFTGGIGENSALMRHRVLQRLEFLGVMLDEDRNRDARVDHGAPIATIAETSSRVKVLVVQADEELAMAGEAAALLAAHVGHPASERIPVAISARHAHLTQATLDRLFGQGYQLRSRTALSQPGQFSAQEVVSLIGPRGRIDNVRLMGPPRAEDQVEISRTDEFTLGVDAPVRVSGDVTNTPGITIEGPQGRVTIVHGVIAARRHIHMSPQDAERLGLRDHDTVSVKIDSDGRDLTFGDVVVRVSPKFRLEMHLDTDEANAAGIQQGDSAELVRTSNVQATIGERGLTGRK
ncbi:MAG TPA: acetate/propionate family kinase [Steroidobacteraceae bacterium]